jgi:hypothetical protein
MNNINCGFVFTGAERWCFEHESMPIILGTIRSTNIRSRFVSDPLLDEFVVDIQLDFNAPVRIAVVYGPSGNSLRVSMIQPAVQRGVCGREKQTNGNCGDDESLADRFSD